MLTEQNIESFLSNNFVGTAWVWAPVVSFILGLWFTHREHLAIRVLTSLLLGFAAFVFCFGFMWAWIFKDGLGPGMIVAQGDEVVAQFKGILVGALAFGAAFLLLAFLPLLFAHFVRRRHRFSSEIKGKCPARGPSTSLDIASFLMPPFLTVLACLVYSESPIWPYLFWIGGFVLIWSGICVLLCAHSPRFRLVAHAWLLGCVCNPVLSLVVLTIVANS